MKANVEIPKVLIDESTKKRIATLERKLKNAEIRADKWKTKSKETDAFLHDVYKIKELAKDIGDLAGLVDKYDADWYGGRGW